MTEIWQKTQALGNNVRQYIILLGTVPLSWNLATQINKGQLLLYNLHLGPMIYQDHSVYNKCHSLTSRGRSSTSLYILWFTLLLLWFPCIIPIIPWFGIYMYTIIPWCGKQTVFPYKPQGFHLMLITSIVHVQVFRSHRISGTMYMRFQVIKKWYIVELPYWMRTDWI